MSKKKNFKVQVGLTFWPGGILRPWGLGPPLKIVAGYPSLGFSFCRDCGSIARGESRLTWKMEGGRKRGNQLDGSLLLREVVCCAPTSGGHHPLPCCSTDPLPLVAGTRPQLWINKEWRQCKTKMTVGPETRWNQEKEKWFRGRGRDWGGVGMGGRRRERCPAVGAGAVTRVAGLVPLTQLKWRRPSWNSGRGTLSDKNQGNPPPIPCC